MKAIFAAVLCFSPSTNPIYTREYKRRVSPHLCCLPARGTNKNSKTNAFQRAIVKDSQTPVVVDVTYSKRFSFPPTPCERNEKIDIPYSALFYYYALRLLDPVQRGKICRCLTLPRSLSLYLAFSFARP